MNEHEQKQLNQRLRELVSDVQDLLQVWELLDSQRESIIEAAASLMDGIVKPVALRASVSPEKKPRPALREVTAAQVKEMAQNPADAERREAPPQVAAPPESRGADPNRLGGDNH